MKEKIEKEYLFESLCEDLKKLQAENEKLYKALEQKDCISRQAVEDAIYDYSRSCDVNYGQIMEYIDKIPPVPLTPLSECEEWKQLKETISEIKENNKYDNDTATELCRFLLNYMGILEKGNERQGDEYIPCNECDEHFHCSDAERVDGCDYMLD